MRGFSYEDITINDIENNKHLIFVCCGDTGMVKVEREEEWKERI